MVKFWCKYDDDGDGDGGRTKLKFTKAENLNFFNFPPLFLFFEFFLPQGMETCVVLINITATF